MGDMGHTISDKAVALLPEAAQGAYKTLQGR